MKLFGTIFFSVLWLNWSCNQLKYPKKNKTIDFRGICANNHIVFLIFFRLIIVILKNNYFVFVLNQEDEEEEYSKKIDDTFDRIIISEKYFR